MRPGQIMRTDPQDAPAARIVPNPFIRAVGESNERLQKSRPWRGDARGIVLPDEPVRVEIDRPGHEHEGGVHGSLKLARRRHDPTQTPRSGVIRRGARAHI